MGSTETASRPSRVTGHLSEGTSDGTAPRVATGAAYDAPRASSRQRCRRRICIQIGDRAERSCLRWERRRRSHRSRGKERSDVCEQIADQRQGIGGLLTRMSVERSTRTSSVTQRAVRSNEWAKDLCQTNTERHRDAQELRTKPCGSHKEHRHTTTVWT